MYGIQRTAATFTKMKFCLSSTTWSMPMSLSSPRSSVTKWRSASQESKSIVNYVMLFFWAIIYGSYLSLRRCRWLAPQNCSKLLCHHVHLCQRLKNTSDVGAAGMFVLRPVVREVQTSFKWEETERACGESCLFIQAEVLNSIQGLQIVAYFTVAMTLWMEALAKCFKCM